MDHITKIKKIRQCLLSIPTNEQDAYQTTYDRILKQGPGLKELALKTLIWVCNVKRPLKMIELQHTLAIEDDMQEIDFEDLESPDTILSACLGFLVFSEAEETVDIVHSSARIFLPKIFDRMNNNSHQTIGLACLAYMSTPEMTKGPSSSLEQFSRRLKDQPFLSYSAQFYGYHVQLVELQCKAELSRFLEHDEIRQAAWQILNFNIGLITS